MDTAGLDCETRILRYHLPRCNLEVACYGPTCHDLTTHIEYGSFRIILKILHIVSIAFYGIVNSFHNISKKCCDVRKKSRKHGPVLLLKLHLR
jgi:hypothetical protein